VPTCSAHNSGQSQQKSPVHTAKRPHTETDHRDRQCKNFRISSDRSPLYIIKQHCQTTGLYCKPGFYQNHPVHDEHVFQTPTFPARHCLSYCKAKFSLFLTLDSIIIYRYVTPLVCTTVLCILSSMVFTAGPWLLLNTWIVFETRLPLEEIWYTAHSTQSTLTETHWVWHGRLDTQIRKKIRPNLMQILRPNSYSWAARISIASCHCQMLQNSWLWLTTQNIPSN